MLLLSFLATRAFHALARLCEEGRRTEGNVHYAPPSPSSPPPRFPVFQSLAYAKFCLLCKLSAFLMVAEEARLVKMENKQSCEMIVGLN